MTDFMVSYSKGKGTYRQYVNGKPVSVSKFDYMELLCKQQGKRYNTSYVIDTPKFRRSYYSYN